MVTRMLKLLLQQDENSEDSSTRFFTELEKTAFKAKVDHNPLILQQECNREINLLNKFLDLQQLDAENYCLGQTRVNLQEEIVKKY